MKAKEIAELLEKQSPVSYALNWDNVGMHIGRDNNIVKKILVTLDIDDKAVEYAVSCDVDMIVAHHPLICKGVKKINEKNEEKYDIDKATLEAKKFALTELNKQREYLIKERDNVKSLVFSGERCAYCGNLLSEYDADKERKAFNELKEVKLNSIVCEGKIIKSKIEELNKEISDLSEIILQGCKKEEYKIAIL